MTCLRCVQLAACGLSLILVTLGFALAQNGQQLDAELTRAQIMRRGKFDGPASCMECHTQPTQNRIELTALDFVLLTEYAAWKTQDKHAQAYAVLHGPRGKQMAEILGLDVSKAQAGCLNCHAMNYLEQKGRPFALDEGVSCGGCHGPSEHWFAPHQSTDWRKLSPEEKAQKGMVDLRHPIKRAELCLSCHVGNATEGKVITHAMYAAGHPPLPPMEIATFALNLPQHWRDAADVPYFHNASAETKRDYHLETIQFQRTRFALVGAIVALRETMQLIADRADPTPKEAAAKLWPELAVAAGGVAPAPATPQAARERWPELAMAHSDCYGCHHELRSKSWRQTRGYGYPLPNGKTLPGIPGRPQIKPWAISLIELAVAQAARAPGAPAAEVRTRELDEQLTRLISSVNAQPFGDPTRMRTVAQRLVTWSNKLLGDLQNAPYDQTAARAILLTLLDLKSLRFADYESARECASILRVVYDDLRVPKDSGSDKQIRKILDDLWTTLDVQPYADRARRQAIMTELLTGLTTEKESLSGMLPFYAALQNLGDLELQKELRRNRFLNTLRDDIGDPKITKELQSPKVIDALQKSSDIELKKSLDVVNDYDPAWFYGQLQQLSKLLK
ncbi:MAG TPA: multiheme c-type cytochrome [Gemmataceae bacterium]|nr:multiheme c-type cytochrome [Gemmataceae bacterium]